MNDNFDYRRSYVPSCIYERFLRHLSEDVWNLVILIDELRLISDDENFCSDDKEVLFEIYNLLQKLLP